MKHRREAPLHPSVPKPAVSSTIRQRPRRESKDAIFDGLRLLQWNCRGSGGTQKIATILHAAEVRQADLLVLNELGESISAFRIRLQSVLSDFYIVGTGRVHRGGGVPPFSRDVTGVSDGRAAGLTARGRPRPFVVTSGRTRLRLLVRT